MNDMNLMSEYLSKKLDEFIADGFASEDKDGRIFLTEKGEKFAKHIVGMLECVYSEEKVREIEKYIDECLLKSEEELDKEIEQKLKEIK